MLGLGVTLGKTFLLINYPVTKRTWRISRSCVRGSSSTYATSHRTPNWRSPPPTPRSCVPSTSCWNSCTVSRNTTTSPGPCVRSSLQLFHDLLLKNVTNNIKLGEYWNKFVSVYCYTTVTRYMIFIAVKENNIHYVTIPKH